MDHRSMETPMYSQAVVLGAGMTVDQARARLRPYGDAHYVVLRRVIGLKLFFYAFTVGELRARTGERGSGGAALWEHLHLGAGDASRTVQAATATQPPRRRTVVLEDDQVAGVMEPLASGERRVPRFRGSTTHGGPDPELRDRTGDEEDGGPLEAHPWLQAPRVVAPEERFTLDIGLSRTQVPGVSGSVNLPRGVEVLELGIEVIAEGFALPEGGRRTLRVRPALLEAGRVSVALVAPADAAIHLSQLGVHFTLRGVACGYAWRRIAVRPAGAGAGPPGGRDWLQEGGAPAPVRLDGEHPADLTVRIDKPDQDQSSGRFVWSFASPHLADLPEPLPVDLGRDADSFARTVIGDVWQNEGTATLKHALRGIGAVVAEKIPDSFFILLRTVWECAAAEGRTPTVLLLSAEPHVPWELALLEEPLDPDRPPFLGAQVPVARWITGRRGIPLPPPRSRHIHQMAVVAGDYASRHKRRPLPHAMREAESLARDYGAVQLSATHDDLGRLLDGEMEEDGVSAGAEAIHFACHGEVDPQNPRYASIFLSDGNVLTPSLFRAAPVGKRNRPFLFLNACQVGQSGELLGEYAGFAGASISAGFSGFLAPLWSVDDQLAHDFALEFYRRAFTPTPVARILCDLRANYRAETGKSTCLAYIFYGHPDLLIPRADEA
jgi:hypothetical protein